MELCVRSEYSDHLTFCRIQTMFADRAIADPIIRAQVFQSEPKPNVANELLAKLKRSQKDMEHRLHPWMEPSVREQIKELESDESRTRRRTIRGETNLTGGKMSKEEAAAQKIRE